MSTPGLLFLLLMSSCLVVLSAPPGTSMGTSPKEGQLKQETLKHRIKDTFRNLNTWLKKNYRVIGGVIAENIGQVPLVGPLIAGATKSLLLLVPQEEPLEVVNSELKVLNFKIDDFRAEMKWDAWAAGAYQITVNNIEKAWNKYTELVHSYPKSTNTENEALKKNFFTFYNQYADSTLDLHQFLTAKPASITQNLGDVLADRLRCHEKDVKAQFLYLNKLMWKGNVLNEKYYEFKGTNTDASVDTAAQIASQSASALTKSHQRCLSHSSAYTERDIFERIDDTKKHQEIADSVWAFLAKTYDRYDWMVVAFTTQHSKHDLTLLNRHTFSGFTEVKRGTVTVAVAKQVKGRHTKTAAVKEAINKCLPKLKVCFDVVKKLEKCQGTIFGKPLSQTFTAVHGYKRNSQTSTNAVEAPDDNDFAIPQSSSLNPHLIKGQCGPFGKFMVFTKSDEELMGKEDLCSNVNCGKNGRCVVVPETFIAMCECQYPYFGERCDRSLERQTLQPTPGRSDNRRSRQSTSQGPSSRRPRQSNSKGPADRRSRQSTSQGPSSRRPRQSNSKGPADRRSRQSTSRRPSSRRPRQSNSKGPADRRSRQSTSRRPSSRRPRQSNSKGPADRRSRQSTSRRPSSRRPRQSNSKGPADRRSRQSTSRRPSSRRPRQSNSKGPADRRSRLSTSRGPSSRRPRQSNSKGPADRRSRQSTSRRPSSRRPRQSNSKGPADRRSRQSTSRRPSSRRPRQSNSKRPADRRSRQSTPERSAQGHDNIKSFCGSLCEDVTTKSY